ncbi:MAG TPA: ABC transporter permease [Gemmatimonadaceae bacterium]|jgi:putative ABC transport system permease protein|nr:ABC transporter permease [Gemmatimonadaceae bacterium]
MARIPGLRRLMRVERGSAGIARAVDDELRFHFEMTVRELMNSGMNPDEARREAERRFGDVQRTRRRLAEIDRARIDQQRRAEWWSGFAQDLRYALRGLRLKPGFAIGVVATLGLGIGANAAMFSIVDRLLFRPPSYLNAPDRAARFYFGRTFRGKENIQSYTGYRPFLDVRENTTSFDAMTPFYVNKLAIGLGEATKEMNVAVSGADLWRMFDVKPVIGRFFTAAEDTPPDGTPVAVISYGFWQTQFAGRNDALGEKIDIGPQKYTIIGVAPKDFTGFSPEQVIAFIPISPQMAAGGWGTRGRQKWYATYGMTWLEVFARRKPTVTREAAEADLTRAYQLSYKKSLVDNPGRQPFDITRPRAIVGPILHDAGPNKGSDAKVATWLAGVTAIVLLIACANVANLLLARALRRRREIALRVALGISRSRLLMQLVTESLVLAFFGGLAGLAIAQWGGGAMRAVLLGDTLTGSSAIVDVRLIVAVAILATAAGLLSGFAPAFTAVRADVASALKAGSREGVMQRSRLRRVLLVAQAALSVVLLVGAGLFVRSLMNVRNVRLGYDADRIAWVGLDMRGVKLDTIQNAQLRDQLLATSRTLPGVEHASRGLTVPFWMTWDLDLYVAGIDSVSKLGDFTLQAGNPEFFSTMGTRIVRGRGFSTTDVSNAPLVMVVGESMAKKLWPNEDALGKCVRVNEDTMPCTTVVGIAEDVRRGSISETEMHYYLPIAQFHPQDGGVFVRTRGPAESQVEAVRRSLQKLMPGASYVTVTPMSAIIAPVVRSWRLGAIMFAIFGALALVLAAIGLYSVIAYNVTQRTHEMGVRVALGAQVRDVVSLIVREGLRVVLPGVLLGSLIALAAGRWVAPLLFEVSPKDPPVLIAVVVTLTLTAIVASLAPALRAARVDPNEALRAD